MREKKNKDPSYVDSIFYGKFSRFCENRFKRKYFMDSNYNVWFLILYIFLRYES